MKRPDQLVADVERRLTRTWGSDLVGPVHESAWPHAFPLGEPSSADLTRDFASTLDLVATWRAWEAEHDVPLRYRGRRVHGTEQELPTHVLVPDLDTAARLCAGPWPERIGRGRLHAGILSERFPHLERPERTLVAVARLSSVDVDVLFRTAEWFARHDATGLTPRQVPIPGVHAKWLNTRQALVRELAGVEDLGLLPRHPARLHFTYLDPDHRAAGGRLHDSVSLGDAVPLPYRPQFVIISENKDTAIHFPPLPGGVSVEGVGKGGATVAAVEWIVQAPWVFYWGDMDADGLEILDGFRAAGVPATSLLMDPAAYEVWEPLGTDLDKNGAALGARPPGPVPHLTDLERRLYSQLVAPSWDRHRRVEQERIPLAVALELVCRLTGTPLPRG